MTPLIVARNLVKCYRRGAESVRALDGIDLDIHAGEFVAIVGPSGSGKTTLLNLIGCLDVPTAGSLLLEGQETSRLSERALTRFRRERIGFVFQHFGLVPTLTVAENVALPALFARRPDPARVDALLRRVGLEHRRNHRPAQLSGGEMQRVALARALVNRPSLLLADEPTGQLDSAAGAAIGDLFEDLHRDGLTIVVVTHNEGLAARAGRRIRLADGRLADVPSGAVPEPIKPR